MKKLGLPTAYLATYNQTLHNGLSTWLNSRHLETVYLEINDEFGRCWSFSELNIQYLASGQTNAFYDDLEAARYEAAKLGSPPSRCSYRIVVHNKPGAAIVSGWSSGALPGTAGMERRRVGGAVGSPDIGASLTIWRRQ